MRATYFISFDGVNYSQFYPTNEPKVKLEQEAGEIFFRWRVDSFKIGATKNASIYANLLHYFFTPAHIATNIYYQIKENNITKFEFIGPVIKGKIDTQNSVYECNPDPDDEYRDILLRYNTKWNELSNDVFEANSTFYYPAINIGLFANINFDTFVDSVRSVTWGNTLGLPESAANSLDISTSDDDTIQVVVTNFTGSSFYLDIVNGAYVSITAGPQLVSGNGVYYFEQTINSVYINVQISNTTIASGSFDYEVYYPSAKSSGDILRDVLYNSLNVAFRMNLSIPTVYSTILFNDALPSNAPASISTYMASNPTKDYVTESAERFNHLWVARADILTTDKMNPFKTSFKEFIDIFKYKWRLWWFFDDDGKFRIEHEKYFRSYDPQIDLTSSTYIKDKSETDKKLYNYNTSDLFNERTFEENNQGSAEWVIAPVYFNQDVTSERIDEIRVSNLTTDLKYLINNPDARGDGFLICRYIGTTRKVFRIDQTTLSWYDAVANYHGYFSEALTGTVNNSAFIFDHVKEFLEQSDIKFHSLTAIDWKKPFTLVGGTGWLKTAEYAPETGMISINVGYDPYK